MDWKIHFYSDKVEEGINDWPLNIRAKFTQIVGLIEEFGPNTIGMPHIRPLGQGLFEIRAKAIEGIGRAFFCTTKGKMVVILSEFIKKSQKTPPKEIALAKKRMAEVKND